MVNSAIEKLSSGRRAADELKDMIGEATGLDPAAKELVNKIISSFSAAMYDLGTAGELKQEPVTTFGAGSTGRSVDQGCGYSAIKKRKTSPAENDRRGGYRRRAAGSDCRKVFVKSLNDGFTWRKYGQKDIFSSKFPRSYFRCTHKYDRGCQATRQVQKSEEESDIYLITYIGEHICQDQAKPPINASLNSRETCVINFESSTVDDAEAEDPFICSPSVPAAATANQEAEEDVVSSQSTPTCSTSSSEFFTSPVIDQFPWFFDGRDLSSSPMPFMEDLYFDGDDDDDDLIWRLDRLF